MEMKAKKGGMKAKDRKGEGLALEELEAHSHAELLPDRLEMRKRSRRWRQHHHGGGGGSGGGSVGV
jgi:hypothetical protein